MEENSLSRLVSENQGHAYRAIEIALNNIREE
jgi:hypothetical protein